MQKIFIVTNESKISKDTEALLKAKLKFEGFEISKEFTGEEELIVCIGGDGAFLATLHRYDFPAVPFVGINTGHLGFFQELLPDQLDDFIGKYKEKKYEIQRLKTVCATFWHEGKHVAFKGLNEIVIKAAHSLSVHLNLAIGDSFIERFSGDGLLFASPAGSTAYNYALGGSIVDPRLNLLQVTPIAPMNTTAYRSFTSSVLLPPDVAVKVFPEEVDKKDILITCDGIEHTYQYISEITFGFSDNIVQLIRLEDYDFWSKVQSKFL